MASFPKSLSPETLASLRGLRLRAQHVVEGLMAGLHRSPFRGHSIEFAEHREYVPGDDLRYVDWKVFGRTDKVYLKQFEDETNLICYLAIDASESMRYRASDSPLSKFEYAQCLAAAIGWLVLQQQDAVGVAVFDEEVRAYLQPASHAGHLNDVLRVIEAAEPSGKTSIAPIFHDLGERFQRRGVIVVIGDLFDKLESLVAGLGHFRRRRHDVAVLHVLDPAELTFPFQTPVVFHGLENWPSVAADPLAMRGAYLREFGAWQRGLEAHCRRQAIDYTLLRTDAPLDRALAGFLTARAARTR